jgi:hypothetical protein
MFPVAFYRILWYNTWHEAGGCARFFIWSRVIARPFVITKGEKMQKVSYMGNGETTEFTFNFPYFENSNVIVTKNGATATNYQVIGTPGGADADIPYSGGKVVFEIAPTTLDSITIARALPLGRAIDYQPTAKIDPTTLNQDMNYMMEVLKDLQDELETLRTQYAEIADKDSTATLLARIATISEDITTVRAQITALGDISTLRQTVTDLSTNVGAIDSRTSNLLDYVIETQIPTAENNYTWYRKYKSGWVEQGGTGNTSNQNDANITLPIRMSDTHYVIQLTCDDNSAGGNFHYAVYKNRSATGFSVALMYGGSAYAGTFNWFTQGMTA